VQDTIYSQGRQNAQKLIASEKIMLPFKKLLMFGLLMFAVTFLFAYMPLMGIKTIGGVQPGWFGFLTLSAAIFSGGFFNLNGFKKGVNKAHNLMMMIIWFLSGSLIFLAALWRIFNELKSL
jgi:hypothetical protein